MNFETQAMKKLPNHHKAEINSLFAASVNDLKKKNNLEEVFT